MTTGSARTIPTAGAVGTTPTPGTLATTGSVPTPVVEPRAPGARIPGDPVLSVSGHGAYVRVPAGDVRSLASTGRAGLPTRPRPLHPGNVGQQTVGGRPPGPTKSRAAQPAVTEGDVCD
ncbi:hypothetical protein GCM10017559_51550 [Streptosporangium longisporum]|uniref:Uncharacterized protein n=1 Tax=Streptosporangium longisporum TaxID=46187 RepID=A0ABN3YED2_9ACTN